MEIGLHCDHDWVPALEVGLGISAYALSLDRVTVWDPRYKRAIDDVHSKRHLASCFQGIAQDFDDMSRRFGLGHQNEIRDQLDQRLEKAPAQIAKAVVCLQQTWLERFIGYPKGLLFFQKVGIAGLRTGALAAAGVSISHFLSGIFD